MKPEALQEMIDAHWDYVKDVIRNAHGGTVIEARMQELEFHYKTAFRHGYKHAMQETDAIAMRHPDYRFPGGHEKMTAPCGSCEKKGECNV